MRLFEHNGLQEKKVFFDVKVQDIIEISPIDFLEKPHHLAAIDPLQTFDKISRSDCLPQCASKELPDL